MPVIDLRLKFGMSKTVMDIDTCVIITEVDLRHDGKDNSAEELAVVGTLADSVQEVVEIPPDDIAPPPRLGAAISTRFIKGMAQQNNRFIIVLDIGAIFFHPGAARPGQSRTGIRAADNAYGTFPYRGLNRMTRIPRILPGAQNNLHRAPAASPQVQLWRARPYAFELQMFNILCSQ